MQLNPQLLTLRRYLRLMLHRRSLEQKENGRRQSWSPETRLARDGQRGKGGGGGNFHSRRSGKRRPAISMPGPFAAQMHSRGSLKLPEESRRRESLGAPLHEFQNIKRAIIREVSSPPFPGLDGRVSSVVPNVSFQSRSLSI